MPVTFGYISDAHDFHGVSGNTHVAYGPGEAGYVQQLKDYDKAFADFFARLRATGSRRTTRSSSSPSRRATTSRAPRRTHPCDGVTTACTYANGHVTEVNGDLRRLVATYNADHGTSATTDFSVHSDMAPNVYVKAIPPATRPTARDLEKAMSDIDVTNPLSGEQRSCSSRWRIRSRRSCCTWSRPTR